MSSVTLGPVWRLPLATTEKLLLAYLADGADQDGELLPGNTNTLAAIVDRTPKTTRHALTVLEKRGYLERDSHCWRLHVHAPSELEKRPPLTIVKTTAEPAADPDTPDPEPTEQRAPEPQRAEPTPSELSANRLSRFCQAWGLTSPSDSLIVKWEELEKTERKYNRTEKHRNEEGDKWEVEVEALEESMPAILHAVKIFQSRAAAGLPNHAETPAAFVDRELWLAPEYQVPRVDTAEPVSEEDQLRAIDKMVGEMNRAGGTNQCHFRTTSRNPHTGEMETETIEVYRNRVQAKYDQYKATQPYFQE